MSLEYYKFKKSKKATQVDWSAIGDSVRKDLAEESKRREKVKEDIKKESDNLRKTLNNVPQGEDRDMNTASLELASNGMQALVMLDNLLQDGKVGFQDYTTRKQNLMSDTQLAYDIIKNYNNTFATATERIDNGQAALQEVDGVRQIERFGNINTSAFFINPDTFRISLARRKLKDPSKPFNSRTNPYTDLIDENPDERYLVSELANIRNQKVDVVNVDEEIKPGIDLLADTYQTIQKTSTGFLKETNIMQNPDYLDAETDIVNEIIGSYETPRPGALLTNYLQEVPEFIFMPGEKEFDPEMPFNNKAEGDEFRRWVNANYPDYAQEKDLDPSGDYDNEYIITAFKDLGESYAKSGKVQTSLVGAGKPFSIVYNPDDPRLFDENGERDQSVLLIQRSSNGIPGNNVPEFTEEQRIMLEEAMTDKIRTALNKKLDITTITPKTKTRTPFSKPKQDRKDLYTGMPVLVKTMTEGNAAEAEKAAKEFMKMHNIGLEVDSKEFLVGIKRLESGGFELQFADNTGALLEPQNELTTDPNLGGQFLYSQFKESGTDGDDYTLTYGQVNDQFRDARITSDTINLEPFSVTGDIPEFAEGPTKSVSEFTVTNDEGEEISLIDFGKSIDEKSGNKEPNKNTKSIEKGIRVIQKQALDAGGFEKLNMKWRPSRTGGTLGTSDVRITYNAGGMDDVTKDIQFPNGMSAEEFFKEVLDFLKDVGSGLTASQTGGDEGGESTQAQASGLKGDLDDVLGLFESS